MKLDLVLDDAQMKKLLEQAGPRGAAAWDVAHFRRAQDVLDVADPLTPRKSGRLWASRVATRTAPVEISFNTPYAATRHEQNLDKFLERALLKIAQEGVRPMARYFEEALKRGDTLASARARHPTTVRGR